MIKIILGGAAIAVGLGLFIVAYAHPDIGAYIAIALFFIVIALCIWEHCDNRTK